jgi:hypothetical protein
MISRGVYPWIVDAIDALIGGVKITIDFLKQFPETMNKFFSSLQESFNGSLN